MILLGLLFLLTGVIMNIKVLRGPLSQRMSPEQIMRTQPFIVSMVLVGIGVVVVILGTR